MDGEKVTNSIKNSWINQGVILGILSVLSYLLTYVYEYGYYRYYGIPSSFINLNITSIITKFITIGFVLIFLILLILSLINMLNLQKPNKILVIIISVLACISIIQLLDFKGISNSISTKPTQSLIVFLVVLSGIIIPYFYLCKKIWKSDDLFQGGVKFSQRRLNKLFIFILVSIMTILSFTYSLGSSRASQNNIFLVTSTKPEMLVITPYENYLICIPFNRKTKEANDQFIIVDPTTRPDITYHLEDIGPIKMLYK